MREAAANKSEFRQVLSSDGLEEGARLIDDSQTIREDSISKLKCCSTSTGRFRAQKLITKFFFLMILIAMTVAVYRRTYDGSEVQTSGEDEEAQAKGYDNQEEIKNYKIEKELISLEDSLYVSELESIQADVESIEDDMTTSNGTDEDIAAKVSQDDSLAGITGLNWYLKASRLKALYEACESKLRNASLSAEEISLARADCGSGYTLPKSYKTIRVVFYGVSWIEGGTFLKLSGCGKSTYCPSNPRCTFHLTTSQSAATKADVVVVPSYDHSLLSSFRNKGAIGKHPIRVIYWRESYWPSSPQVKFQKTNADLIMGVHMQSDLHNPSFIMYPSLLKKGILQDGSVEKTGFAVSLTSDCTTLSMRHILLNKLAELLGADRIDRFGRCYHRKVPGSGMFGLSKFLSKYKLLVY